VQHSSEENKFISLFYPLNWCIFIKHKCRGFAMAIEKVIRKEKLSELKNTDLKYWLSRPVEERFSAVQTLREVVCGTGHPAGIQRVVRIIQQKRS
jgi:hypothetical protein